VRTIFLMAALAVTALGATLPKGNPKDVGLAADRLARIRPAIQAYIDRHEIAGAVALIARRGKVAYLETMGVMDLESRKPMQPDTIFRIASMTKPIASVAAMMLYEEGRFQLNDPVSKFIPEFKDPKVAVPTAPNETASAMYRTVPAAREITIRDLLTHTAGLANTYNGVTMEAYARLARERQPEDTVGDMTKRLAKLPLQFHPGTAWAYGPATDVVGHLVEVISGQALDRFFEERIFQPLGMADTHFYAPPGKEARYATAYTPAQPKGLKPTPRLPGGARRYFSGAGGLASTAPDYFRFSQMLLNGGQLDGARLLSPKTVELMTSNHIGKLPLWPTLAGYRFGLGFRVLTDLGEAANAGSVGNYGWGGALGTIFWNDPKEQLIGILMIQVRPYNHLNIRQDIQTLAYQAMVD